MVSQNKKQGDRNDRAHPDNPPSEICFDYVRNSGTWYLDIIADISNRGELLILQISPVSYQIPSPLYIV